MGLSTTGRPITRWEGSWAERTIYAAGRLAFTAGVRYEDNPHRDPASRLAWSKGHNDQRAQGCGPVFHAMRVQPGAK